MYVLKGFVDHALLVQNTVGVTAQIGELSTESMTYSREKGSYVSSSASDLTLTTFISKLDGVATPATQNISMTETVSDHVLIVSKWVYDQSLVGGNPVNADELLQGLITEFQTSAEDFKCGEITFDGHYYVPQWVSWKHKTLNGGDNYFRVWFVDASFRSQYDEYEIVVVAPFDRLDDFFKTASEVGAELAALTLSEQMDRLQVAKQNHPETIIRSEQYDYISPLNSAVRFHSNWGLLIYGLAGNNVDAIKDTLVSYILANSTHTRAEWTAILPDIFKRTEFMLVPQWESYAIPNRTLEAGIYSPVAGLTSSLNLIKQVVAGYSDAHIIAHASVLAHPYKCLSVLAVGGPDNRDSLFDFTDVFPDYISVSTTSLDFNRMSADTKGMALLLEQMILIAETMGQYTDLPYGMTKTVRDNVLYLVANYKNIHYLVAAKSNFPLH